MIDWISTKYYNIKNGLVNLWRYLPLIWNTREWDHCFLLMLMEAKFRRMAVAIGDEGHLLKADRSGKQLRTCAELCRRIREDNYLDNLTGPVEYKTWWTPVDDFEGAHEYHCEISKDGKPLPDGQFREWCKMAERNKKNDLDYLCLMMRKHLLSWWD